MQTHIIRERKQRNRHFLLGLRPRQGPPTVLILPHHSDRGRPRLMGGVPGGEPAGGSTLPCLSSHQHMDVSSSQMPACDVMGCN